MGLGSRPTSRLLLTTLGIGLVGGTLLYEGFGLIKVLGAVVLLAGVYVAHRR